MVNKDSKRNLERLLRICGRRGRVLVLMQNNPDPDAIASALMVREIVRTRLHKSVTIGYGGVQLSHLMPRMRDDYLKLVHADTTEPQPVRQRAQQQGRDQTDDNDRNQGRGMMHSRFVTQAGDGGNPVRARPTREMGDSGPVSR